MTEGQAKEKWCPMVRHQQTNEEPASNRYGPDPAAWEINTPPFSRCIASECMMWRWHSINHPREFPHENARTELSKTDGYCGLAGAP